MCIFDAFLKYPSQTLPSKCFLSPFVAFDVAAGAVDKFFRVAAFQFPPFVCFVLLLRRLLGQWPSRKLRVTLESDASVPHRSSFREHPDMMSASEEGHGRADV